METQDKTLLCEDCREPFIFSARDQFFYAQRDFSTPRRCKPCRELKRARFEDRDQRAGGWS
jgi:hypothetical protein